TAGMNATVNTPYILINGNEISNLDLKANTSDSGLHITGNIARIKQGNSFDVYNTRVNATALNNIIDFSLGIDDQNARNKYYLSGVLTQPSSGTYSLQLSPDSLLLNYELWSVTPNNNITFSPSAIRANNFVLEKGNQRLSLNSLAGNDQPLQVSFNEFRVSTITGFIKSDSVLVDGVMNGEVTFRNLMQTPVFTSNLTINDLSLRQDTIGNVNLQVSSAANNRYITNATITGRGNDVSFSGSFAPMGKDIDLDLNLAVRQLQLNTMEGALASAITNASGSINGNVRIAGTTADPNINGDLNFNNASFALTMLGSQFRIDNERLSVTEEGFGFDNFTIRDSLDNTLTLNGNVLTSNFINYDFDLRVNARNFEVLNSTKEQNKIYYGKLNITADLNIFGTETKPVVDGSVIVNEGTNLFVVVPQAEPGIVEREGVVQFVDMDSPGNDTLFLAYDSINTANILGFDIAANIEIKKEAILNVIVDEANGDFLNVQGEALLSAGIDPSGKITLVGNYTLEEGSYQLSFNFIQRRFDIQKGSTITWTGEPTTALLNVDAVYVANTSPIDLVSDQLSADANRNLYLQKLPFEVHLNLTGELLKPVVDFDIILPEGSYGISNEIITTVETRLNMIRQ
ncbi:MAG TPA: translocation/assembly module TamB domain-containing protein, partial [Flavisolibacter sp.]